MKRRLAVTIVLVALLPLVLLAWLGTRLAAAEEKNVRRQFHDLAVQRLATWRDQVDSLFEEQGREFDQQLAAAPRWSTEEHEAFMKAHPLARQTFVLNRQAYLLYPAGPFYSSDEQAFRSRLSGLVGSHSHLFEEAAVAQQMFGEAQAAQQGSSAGGYENVGELPQSGWSAWYERSGLELMYFSKLSNGLVIGSEIDRVRMMAEIIAVLPDTPAAMSSRNVEQGLVRLVDEKGRLIYQWGVFEIPEGVVPLAVLALERPLSAWSLEYYSQPTAAVGSAARFGMFGGLAAAGIAMLGLVIFLYREYAREMHEAEQRVSFVSQVSHELKTPLTNIRMYAELLEEEVEEDESGARRHLGIIVNESQRLTRLIENVLTFSKDGRGGLKLRRRETVIDELIVQLLEQFRPSLKERGMNVEMDLHAPNAIECDPDALRQIVGNLITNAEKYAAGGACLRVETEQDDAGVRIRVIDKGEGIPLSAREKVFKPFYRIDNSLTSGVSGAGIGLSIARNLARMHDGDLKLLKSRGGCEFEVTLPGGRSIR